MTVVQSSGGEEVVVLTAVILGTMEGAVAFGMGEDASIALSSNRCHE